MGSPAALVQAAAVAWVPSTGAPPVIYRALRVWAPRAPGRHSRFGKCSHHLQASTKAEGSPSKKVTGSGAVQLPRALMKCPMQQSPLVTAPGAPVAIDMADVQQLLEEMALWSVHFQISWVSSQLLLFAFFSLHDT